MDIFKERIKKIANIFALPYKRVRNRIPEGLVDFTQRKIVPFTGLALLLFFTLGANFAKAAEEAYAYQPSEDMMDLSPADVADVAAKTAPYTKFVEVDPVNVALAMESSDFLGAPVIASTQVTVPPQSEVKRNANITYTVLGGDTLSSIGWKFGLKIASIKALNNLSGDTIRPGQQLKIPPADLDQKTLDSLKTKRVAGATTVRRSPGSSNNAYPWGWCTYYVATRRYVPGGWGNARSWLSSAQRAGYATGSEPAVGAIVVTAESGWGHVAYVESVSGESITIAEMNYVAWGVASRRTISAHAGVVRGYIY